MNFAFTGIGENEAREASHVCDDGRAQQGGGWCQEDAVLRPSGQPSQQHRHLQPRGPSRPQETGRMEGKPLQFHAPLTRSMCIHQYEGQHHIRRHDEGVDGN